MKQAVTSGNCGKKKLLTLFFSMLYISAFTFGGGYVIVTLMKKRFTDELHWLDEKEMLDLTAIAQSSPGAIAVNAAILVGWKVDGLIGMATSVLATIIPPMVILSIVSLIYKMVATNLYVSLVLKGMQAGVSAVVLDAVCSLGSSVLKEKSILSDIIIAAAFIAGFFLNVNVIYIILTAAAIGVIKALYFSKKKKEGSHV